MLVLSRQRDETIMIGDDIEITVVDIRGDKVRLGITAPSTVPVHRKEVYEAIQRENREAAKVRMEDVTNLPRSGGAPGLPGENRGKPLPPRGSIPVTRPNPPSHEKNGSSQAGRSNAAPGEAGSPPPGPLDSQT